MYRRKRSKNSKKLLEEGIKTLTQKGRNQNMIKEWTAVLIYIAELEKDIPTIRHYAKKIALEDKGNIEYYEKWKNTYPEKQWQEVIEKEIKELEDDYNQKRGKKIKLLELFNRFSYIILYLRTRR